MVSSIPVVARKLRSAATQPAILPLYSSVAKAIYYGRNRYCPCCRSSVRAFKPYGLIPRANACCPVCFSLERHRLIALYLAEKTDLFDARRKSMLHVAPEPQLARIFSRLGQVEYTSADLDSRWAKIRMDITQIQFPDESFDVIYCSHVLEHVPDDQQAMREFFRVLKPSGWAILQVPITVPETYEDPSITDPRERERVFGQHDHVRVYGPDYQERLAKAGFQVFPDDFAAQLDDATVLRLGLNAEEIIYLRYLWLLKREYEPPRLREIFADKTVHAICRPSATADPAWIT